MLRGRDSNYSTRERRTVS